MTALDIRSENRRRTNVGEHLDEFVGRKEELDELGRLVEPAGYAFVTGPPGSGKSRLAEEYARRALRREADEAWLVDARDAGTSEALVDSMASVLGIRETAGDPSHLARSLAARGSCVVVLDDIERGINDAVMLARDLAEATTSLRLIVTSRTRPDDVPGLNLHGLSRADGRALLVRRASHSVAGDVADNDAMIDGILDRLGHLPLPVELAASFLGVMSPRQLLERLERQRGNGTPSVLADYDTAVRMSWDRLSEREREIFAGCAIFPRDFDADAASAVIDGDDVVQTLAKLQRASLLASRRPDDGDSIRLYLLDTIRAFASSRLESSRRAALLERHAEYFGELGLENWRRVGSSESRDAIARLGRRARDLEGVVARSVQGEVARRHGIAAGLGLAALHTYRDTRRVFVDHVEPLWESRGEALTTWEFRLFEELGHAYIDADLTEKPRPVFEALEEDARRRANSESVARALRGLARCLHREGNFEEALATVDEMKATLADVDAPGLNALADRTWAGIAFPLPGHFDDVQQRLDRAARAFRRLKQPRDEAMCYYLMAYALSGRGETAREREVLNRAAELFREAGDVGLAVESDWLRANVEASAGDLDEAVARLRSVRSESLRNGMIGTAKCSLEIEVDVAIERGALDEAAELLDEQAELLELRADPIAWFWYHVQRARRHAHAGEWEVAAGILGQELANPHPHWNSGLEAWARATHVACLAHDGRIDEARAELESARELADGLDAPVWTRVVDVAALHVDLLEAARPGSAIEIAATLAGYTADDLYEQSGAARSAARLLLNALPTSARDVFESLMSEPETLVVRRDGSGYLSRDATKWVELEGRKRLVDALASLVGAGSGETVDVASLQAAIWPGEKMTEESALNRIRATISMLRKTGLGDRIEFRDGGYGLSEDLTVHEV